MVRTVQAASGMLFAAFLSVHLLNTWLAAAGSGMYTTVQALASTVYQAALLEWLILAAVVVHAGCAVLRWRRERRGPLPWRARLHRYSGIFLLLVIGGHVAAVRLVPGWFGIRPGFDGVAFSLAWLPGWFYPYYWLLGVAGAYHAANGLMLAGARLLGWRVPGAGWVYGVAAGAALLTLAALLGFGGMLYDTSDPWQSAFARLYLRLIDG